MLEFSVVINTRDHPDQLRECLNALEAQTLDPALWEIVVVDDGSADDRTAEVAENFGGKSECRIARISPTGRAGARNAGIDLARGKRILFIGDDILAEPDLLEEHLAAQRRYPKAAVVGFREESSVVPSGVFYEWWNNLYYENIENPQDASFAFFYTCNVSVDRQILLDSGGFDENFICYGWEDLDLGLRLEKLGYRVVFHPRARAAHHHPGASLEALCRREYELAFTACYFFGKWPEEPEVQVIRFWDGDPADVEVGPRWRKKLGQFAIAAVERVWPARMLLEPLYLRLMTSYRHAGLRDGAAHYAPLLEQFHSGKLDAQERWRRFQT